MKRLFLPLLVAMACTDKDPDTDTDTPIGHTDTDLPPADATWHMVHENVPGSMFLSAWSQGDALVMAGGTQDQSEGTLTWLENNELCVQKVADEVLWWVHGTSATRYFAVGEGGTVLAVADGVVTREDVPTTATLYGVFDTGTDVWAVGGDTSVQPARGEIWHRVDGTWSLFRGDLPGAAFKVWEDRIVGEGYAFRWDGATWADDALPEGDERLLTVRGAGDDPVWAVGGLINPVILRDTGSGYQTEAIDPFCHTNTLNGVYANEGGHVLVAGFSGLATFYDGASWHCADFPITFEHFHAAWTHRGTHYFLGGNLFSTDNYGAIGAYGVAPEEPVTIAPTCSRLTLP